MDPYIWKSFFTSFILDGVLQNMGPKRFYLNEYFSRHGPVESMMLAGSTAAFGATIDMIVNPSQNIFISFTTGVILDFIWRYGHIYNTLNEFYDNMPSHYTSFWSGIALVLPRIW